MKDQHLHLSTGVCWDHHLAAGGVVHSDKINAMPFISAVQSYCGSVEVKLVDLAWSGQNASSKLAV